MSFVVHPAATAAFMAALAWLVQRRRYRAVAALNTAWMNALVDIRAMPRRFPLVGNSPPGREFRECYVVRASYRIIFEITPTEIRVSAFVHTRRHQNRWLNQLDPE